MVRRDLATRRRLARQWLDSGLSAREFCSAHGLALSSLQRWTRELRESGLVRQAPGRFLEVTPAPPSRSVRLSVGGVTLELEQLPPVGYVAALGRATC